MREVQAVAGVLEINFSLAGKLLYSRRMISGIVGFDKPFDSKNREENSIIEGYEVSEVRS